MKNNIENSLFCGVDFNTIKNSSGLKFSEIKEVNEELSLATENVVFHLKNKLDKTLNLDEKEEIINILEKFKIGDLGLGLAGKTKFLNDCHKIADLSFDAQKYHDIILLISFIFGRDRIGGRKKDGSFGKIPETADSATGMFYKIYYNRHIKKTKLKNINRICNK